MFKVSKLRDVADEDIKISFVTQELYKYKEGMVDSFETLSFEINGDIENDHYSLSFDLNCEPKKLLTIEPLKLIDFKDYLFSSETYFDVNGVTDTDPELDIKINRYLNNKYIIIIKLYSELINNNKNNLYFCNIEFDFNLDDYLR